jgi:hypothetical protein
MKTAIFTIIVTLGAMSIFTACEKPDYQDPRYRSSH